VAVRSIAVTTVGRSDFGLYEPLLEAIRADPSLELRLMPSGAHFDPSFGPTIRDIETLGFDYERGLELTYASDDAASFAQALGAGVQRFGHAFAKARPHLLLVLGDRLEMLCSAVAALPWNIPLVHLYGGKVSEGAVDELVRHALTKMSHLHFVTCDLHAKRLRQMGEEPWRVHNYGSPGLDRIRRAPRAKRSDLCARLDLDPTRPFLLATYHPVTLESEHHGVQVESFFAALGTYDQQIVVTYPNADVGNREVIATIERFAASRPSDVRVLKNAGSHQYFDLMAHAAAMAGNSSSGIAEAPSFELPAVNVGSRQAGFERAANVIDTGHDAHEISLAIQRAVSEQFRIGLRGLKNPYGDGRSSARIVDELRSVPLDARLVRKRFIDLPAA
jgi:UDP-hydrolysing UDP-N-acetyl-D-glucosamine 2-epimerase